MAEGSSSIGVRAVPASINGWSAEYIDGEYKRYQADPSSVAADLGAFFAGFDLAGAREGGASAVPASGGASAFQNRADALVTAYRESGHLAAKLDPFDRAREEVPVLALAQWGLSESDLNRQLAPGTIAAGTMSSGAATLGDVVSHLRQTYCGSIGLEFMHIRDAAERAWFLEKFERRGGMKPLSKADKLHVLEQLARAEGFEAFCQVRYSTTKRFSLEGGTSLIPMLDAVLDHGASAVGLEEMVIGMAHRGRLNVLSNTLGKTYPQIFTEFEDNWAEGFADGGGDVKYHRGYSGTRVLRSGKGVELAMASNPSHLESVNGVVLGRCRAKQRVRGDTKSRTRVAPLLIHGDAAVAGQGIVAECLNMMGLEGYTVGGALHVVINNMIGFTTIPGDGRSTEYCTDIAKAYEVPVLHVNGEDPEACVAVAKLAIEYRQQFKKDVFIDLVCYRKHGHNEQDEQSYTQPTLAQLIKNRKPTVVLYGQRLIDEGIIDRAEVAAIEERIKAELDSAQTKAKQSPQVPTIDPGSARWKGITSKYSFDPVKTGVPAAVLTELCETMARVPEGFNVNGKLAGLLQSRRDLPKAGKVNHADAELLAFGSLLGEGIPVRLSGQDCRRGTFTQRHAVLRDALTGAAHVSLNHIREMGEWATKDREPGTVISSGPDKGKKRQAQFCVWDSPLSEVSVMGFDYGYSLADPNMLVLWEGQFGDFANGAQVMIDQYLASAEIKWARWSGLVLLLPHGYEGAGPEHSSARLERFLSLCGDNNMEVCYPSTAAQHFHMLRRQVSRNFRKPLIVMSPKSGLRNLTSTFQELVDGRFHEMIDDPAVVSGEIDRKGITRVIFCTGKIYHELADRRAKTGMRGAALVRIEQLYPFHETLAKSIVEKYGSKLEYVWCQEEPRNAGAFIYVADRFNEVLGVSLKYIGRATSATPAVGSKHAHEDQQRAILDKAIAPLAAKDAQQGVEKAAHVNGAAAKPVERPIAKPSAKVDPKAAAKGKPGRR
jgi:2-oxoglutarate dehydrogenase E1 component